MLVFKESYYVTTLCKADPDAIERCNDTFNAIRREIIEIDPECIHVQVTPCSCVKTTRSFGERTIYVCRLTWYVEGEKEFLEKFFCIWKERVDNNPFRSFYVRPNYSNSQLEALFNVR